jgi:2-dehydropantoate 2-reductase
VTRAVESNGLTIKAADRRADIHVPSLRTAPSLPEALARSGVYDLALFTMKSYDTLTAIQEIQAGPDPGLPIVCLQNGVGNEETLGEAFGKDRIVSGVLTTPVSFAGPGVIQEEMRRGIALAADSPAFRTASDAFAGTSLRFSVAANGDSLKWSKLLLNLIGNASSAILDMRPADLFADAELFAVEILALRETLAIMKLHGIRAINLPGLPASTLSALVSSLPIRVLHPILRRHFSAGRGDKLPSLALALRQGQHKTEAAWLNGAVARAARNKEHLAPVNHALALTVSDIASGRVPWEMFRHKPEMLLTTIRAARGRTDASVW